MKVFCVMIVLIQSMNAYSDSFAQGSRFTLKKPAQGCEFTTVIVEGKIQCSRPLLAPYCSFINNPQVKSGNVCKLEEVNHISNGLTGLTEVEMRFDDVLKCPTMTCTHGVFRGFGVGNQSMTPGKIRETLADLIEIRGSIEESHGPAVNNSNRGLADRDRSPQRVARPARSARTSQQ